MFVDVVDYMSTYFMTLCLISEHTTGKCFYYLHTKRILKEQPQSRPSPVCDSVSLWHIVTLGQVQHVCREI